MNITKDQLNSVCDRAYRYYLDLFGKYIYNSRKILVKLDNQMDFPSDKIDVPACTHLDGDIFIIEFNTPILLTKFSNHINFICWHEVAHVVCDELYRCNPGISQPNLVNGGHPVLFFKIINSWKDSTLSDRELQHNRHEIPYNYGRSKGFDKGYNPIDELTPVMNQFKYRILKVFSN